MVTLDCRFPRVTTYARMDALVQTKYNAFLHSLIGGNTSVRNKNIWHALYVQRLSLSRPDAPGKGRGASSNSSLLYRYQSTCSPVHPIPPHPQQPLLSRTDLSRLLASGLHSVLGRTDSGLGGIGGLMLHILSSLQGRALLAAAPQEDTGNLNNTNTSKEEVDGSEPGTSQLGIKTPVMGGRTRRYEA